MESGSVQIKLSNLVVDGIEPFVWVVGERTPEKVHYKIGQWDVIDLEVASLMHHSSMYERDQPKAQVAAVNAYLWVSVGDCV